MSTALQDLYDDLQEDYLTLRKENVRLVEVLEKIARINAMDYEYRQRTREDLKGESDG